MRIYLIDDDSVSNFLFRSMLARFVSPHVLHIFLSGAEVLEELNTLETNEYPHILFIDLSMPVMDGWELLEELGKLHPGLCDTCRIYILTSSIREADRAKGWAHPLVSGFLHKPLSRQDIQSIFSGTLNGTVK